MYLTSSIMMRSDLPFGSEFSPSQISLFHVLELAHQYGGDWKAFEAAIRETYFEKHRTSDYNKRKLANNTKLGMIAYELIDRDANLTDLDYIATRLKGKQTGGAEVDVIFESSRLVYSRWQVQCKNSKVVTLDDIAKEVGITHFLKSNVIVVMTTGKVGAEARKYANKIMTDSNLCIVIADGDDIVGITKNPPAIAHIFNREAKNAMKLKAISI